MSVAILAQALLIQALSLFHPRSAVACRLWLFCDWAAAFALSRGAYWIDRGSSGRDIAYSRVAMRSDSNESADAPSGAEAAIGQLSSNTDSSGKLPRGAAKRATAAMKYERISSLCHVLHWTHSLVSARY